MSTVITAENLSKKYTIHHRKRERYTALRDVIMNKVGEFAAKLRHPLAANTKINNTREEFWALKDINFEIQQGERVGIIGRNGAGKSTLLKILSRITEPTTGRLAIKGRVASLLEVGTGFHPELTGRENIFLNGAILGMGRIEIKRKFDEIVDFAEVEKFLDTPVKRYSSGMYVRLAFSVAAHLEPDILIVDEVLAVGDAEFQKKCLGKMQEVGAEGRTVLFVSHNMSAIKDICNNAILLQKGKILNSGNASDIVRQYLTKNIPLSSHYINNSTSSDKDEAVLEEASIYDSEMNQRQFFSIGEDFSILMKWSFFKKINNIAIAIRFFNENGVFITATNTLNTNFAVDSKSTKTLLCNIENRFSPGRYFLSIGCYIRPYKKIHIISECISFVIEETIDKNSSVSNIVGNPIFYLSSMWEY